ncbi:MAG TPA: hypothetical protein VFB62_13610 [Polyangiaceae bacterium]|nr:hypothetical protein [Polyangiaceae bacterium]
MTPAKDAVARRSGTSLFIVAGNYMPTCTNNEHPQQCGYWRIEIELRQEAQQPGTYELANWGFGSASSIIDEWLGTPGDTDCGFGGGVGGGTIELIELDASHVVFDLSGVLIFADGANGPHEASMCP